jgi:flagellin
VRQFQHARASPPAAIAIALPGAVFPDAGPADSSELSNAPTHGFGGESAMSLSISGGSQHSLTSLHEADRRLQNTFRHLATGKRIASAADDAAGLAVASRLNAAVRSLDQGGRNLADGQDLARTADGALQGTQDALARMRELSVQAQNGTLSNEDRATIQQEYDQLSQQIDQTAQGTTFAGQKLLDGSASSGVQITDGQGGGVDLQIADQSASTLGVAGRSVSDPNTLAALDAATDRVSQTRSQLGSADNRLASQGRSLSTTSEALASAQSRIEDADVAFEMAQKAQDAVRRDLASLTSLHSRASAQRVLSVLA